MHWADVAAGKLAEKGGSHVFATAITPSGPIHVGNMREVLTTEAVFRAAKGRGLPSELLYIADSYDPLRKVYPFLDEKRFAPYVGRPLAEVPCPCDPAGPVMHSSYAQHFLEPFLEALKDLGVAPRVLDAYTMYHEGMYREAIVAALEHTDAIRAIVEKESGRKLPDGWLPFNVQCGSCGRLSGVVPKLYEFPVIQYACPCGPGGEVDVREPGVGKLPWRVDWPARWGFLGVTFESFGKDHAAAGGSWDTGVRISREVYEYPEPEHLVYEFIQLRGKGAMHSSTGTALAAGEMLRMTPPEVLRFLLMASEPKKHIDFDPGLGILTLVDEYDSAERMAWGAEPAAPGWPDVERIYELSQPRAKPARMPHQVAYRHLVTVVQMAATAEEALAVLTRSGDLPERLPPDERARLASRIGHVRYWLAHHAPDEVKFQVQAEPPALALTPAERSLLAALADGLARARWTGKDIHDAIYAVATERGGKANEAFRVVYLAILGKERGPRAGHFLSALDRKFVVERFQALASR